MSVAASGDELGAHVSTAGGVGRAPERARAIDSANLQLFTKQPSRWAEPAPDPASARSFREERSRLGIRFAVAHDAYLINLASPDPVLWERSLDAFRGELARAAALGLDGVVTHPGNATDGDEQGGIERNAEGLARALLEVEDAPKVLLEITAGSGRSIGGSFANLSRILELVPAGLRDRLGICFDTCHVFAAGYDLAGDYEGVWVRFQDELGSEGPDLFHLNDSKHPLGSRKDRHEHISLGTLGEEPFRRIMTDERFRGTPKLLETPKGDDMVTFDRENLARLRRYREEG